jgi:hypothetical protein
MLSAPTPPVTIAAGLALERVREAGARASGLGGRGHQGSGTEVRRGLGQGRAELLSRMRGEPDDGVVAEQGATGGDADVVLAHVHTVGADLEGELGGVVHDERNVEVATDRASAGRP